MPSHCCCCALPRRWAGGWRAVCAYAVLAAVESPFFDLVPVGQHAEGEFPLIGFGNAQSPTLLPTKDRGRIGHANLRRRGHLTSRWCWAVRGHRGGACGQRTCQCQCDQRKNAAIHRRSLPHERSSVRQCSAACCTVFSRGGAWGGKRTKGKTRWLGRELAVLACIRSAFCLFLVLSCTRKCSSHSG